LADPDTWFSEKLKETKTPTPGQNSQCKNTHRWLNNEFTRRRVGKEPQARLPRIAKYLLKKRGKMRCHGFPGGGMEGEGRGVYRTKKRSYVPCPQIEPNGSSAEGVAMKKGGKKSAACRPRTRSLGESEVEEVIPEGK